MTSDFWRGALALAVVMFCLFSENAATAQQAPAVSAPNGKIEFDAGALNLPGPIFMARAAGTVTVPIGERFGLQADLSASTAPGFITTGALHLFTRDPAAYLIGGTLGFVRSPGATVLAAGPEAEVYLDRWTLEAWGGVAVAYPTAAAMPNRVGPFVMTNAAYYVTENWRLSLGVSWLDSYGALQVGSEYLIEGLSVPLAVTTELRVGQDGASRAMIGLRGHFGPDPNKTLMRRHREDDPADRGSALYAAIGGQTLGGASGIARTTGSDGSGGSSEDEGDSGSVDPICLSDNPPPGYGC
ncbi:MAG TPA: hypothetical protein VFE64_00175 [Devosia sp.]|nr:hypothetical protein [Devosia sp.]